MLAASKQDHRRQNCTPLIPICSDPFCKWVLGAHSHMKYRICGALLFCLSQIVSARDDATNTVLVLFVALSVLKFVVTCYFLWCCAICVTCLVRFLSTATPQFVDVNHPIFRLGYITWISLPPQPGCSNREQ